MAYRELFFISLLCVFMSYASDLVDLEDMTQDFVVNSQQLIIPGYPDAFNPSIIRWNGRLLMSFRVVPDPADSFTTWIGLVWLDDNFQPVSGVQKLYMRVPQSMVPPRLEDGRLVTAGGCLYLAYSDNEDSIISRGGFRMYIAELHYDGTKFIVLHSERLSLFEGNDPDRREKNWVPFEYNNSLLLAYSIVPHHILYPLLDGTQRCSTVAFSQCECGWDWGELRGGTPGFLDGDEYLAFFHSSKRMQSVHSKGKEMRHYFMGAYTFSSQHPFNITRMSPQPIIGKNFYHGAEYKPWKNWGSVVAVFPCGFIMDEQYVWIAYGRQDHEIWITQLDKKKLYESLIPVAPKARKQGKNQLLV